MLLLLLAACLGTCPDTPGALPVDVRSSLPSDAADALERFIGVRLEESCAPSFAVAIAANGQVVHEGAYGWADIEAGRAATADTAYMVASVSKAIDGVAVMQAVEDGLLDLDAPADPGFPLTQPDTGDAVLLRHLVTHTSGIADDWGVLETEYVDGDHPTPLAEFIEGYLVPGGDWYGRGSWSGAAPGEEADYSNVGAATGALSVQVARGQAFDAWCEAEIFGPAGMTRSHWFLGDFEDVTTVASPHEWSGGEWWSIPHYGFPTWPDGQLRTTPGDLARLMLAVEDGTLLSAASAETLRSHQSPLPADGEPQGVFWYQERILGQEMWGHNGGEEGVSADMFWSGESGVGFVLITNASEEARRSTVYDAMMDIGEELLRVGTAL